VKYCLISQYKCSGDNIDLNCVNCILLNEKLQNELQELKLAWSIIALPQEDMNNIRELESTRQPTLFSVVNRYNVNLLVNGFLFQ